MRVSQPKSPYMFVYYNSRSRSTQFDTDDRFHFAAGLVAASVATRARATATWPAHLLTLDRCIQAHHLAHCAEFVARPHTWDSRSRTYFGRSVTRTNEPDILDRRWRLVPLFCFLSWRDPNTMLMAAVVRFSFHEMRCTQVECSSQADSSIGSRVPILVFVNC
jgi:hypothetical protein